MIFRRAEAGDERGMAAVHVESWKTTYRGIVSDEYLESLKIEEREESWKKGIFTPRHLLLKRSGALSV